MSKENKIKLTIVDFSGGGDGITAVYIGDELKTSGDYYHNHINQWVEGFIDGLKHVLGNENVVIDFIELDENHPLVYSTWELDEPAPSKLSEIDIKAKMD